MSKSLLFKFPEFSKGSDNISRKYFSLACVVIVFLKLKMNPSMVFFNWCKWWWERIGYFRNYFFKHYLNINLRIPTVPFQSWKNCWNLIDIGLLYTCISTELEPSCMLAFQFSLHSCTQAREMRSIKKKLQERFTNNVQFGSGTHFLESCLLKFFLFH